MTTGFLKAFPRQKALKENSFGASSSGSLQWAVSSSYSL
jgi:hypothetical protein